MICDHVKTECPSWCPHRIEHNYLKDCDVNQCHREVSDVKCIEVKVEDCCTTSNINNDEPITVDKLRALVSIIEKIKNDDVCIVLIPVGDGTFEIRYYPRSYFKS